MRVNRYNLEIQLEWHKNQVRDLRRTLRKAIEEKIFHIRKIQEIREELNALNEEAESATNDPTLPRGNATPEIFSGIRGSRTSMAENQKEEEATEQGEDPDLEDGKEG